MKPIIEVKNISKKYRIGVKQPYYSLRDTLVSAFKHPFSSFKRKKTKENGLFEDEFWALKDINFSVEQGEVLGIIGRNGAGKSTLLKILSQITPPTTGELILRGRVASLLEVGTGFHPELTGRENIFLNGAILGMRQKEIKKKFDEIVDFAEVEKFLDTSMKHYSSGMYMRLAFSVAAHLEPEILLVDEVLAVGDTQFQKKCLGKMGDIAKEGRTVIYVSHNMNSIKDLCENAILLQNGKIVLNDRVDKVIKKYLLDFQDLSRKSVIMRSDRRGMGRIKIQKIIINGGKIVRSGEKYEILIDYASNHKNFLKNCRLGLTFKDFSDQYLFICATEVYFNQPLNLPPNGLIKCIIDKLPLTEGDYFIDAFFEVNNTIEDWIFNAISFKVLPGKYYMGLRQYPPGYEGKGVLVDHKWAYSLE